MTEDIEIILSPLTQTYSAEGHSINIEIYRDHGSAWILEVVDEHGTSIVWDESFDTDKAALEAAFLAIEEKGLASFVAQALQKAKEIEPALLGQLKQTMQSFTPDQLPYMMNEPLSDKELDELNQFLLYTDTEECMTLDMLDGFLHAIAIGPETILPSRWLPKIWRQKEGSMTLPVEDEQQANYLLSLIMRYFNSIVSGFELQPPFVDPLWMTTQYGRLGEFDDAEGWAYGFCEGVNLNRATWRPLLRDKQGARWYRPIGLLGEDGFSPDQNALTRTPEQRQALAQEIVDSLKKIHAHWLSVRHVVAERQQVQRISTKIGRNKPCPCGSGKKFKKCCGAPSVLH